MEREKSRVLENHINFMNVLYYYCYLFYSRIIPDTEPHATVIFVLSFSESLIVNYTIDTIGVHFMCKFLLVIWHKLAITALILIINYLTFYRTGRSIVIVKNKPKFLGSNKISVLVTLLFFLASISLLFWMSDYLLFVLEKCQ
jgi:hypothetical protein